MIRIGSVAYISVLVLLSSILLSGCAPGLGSSMRIDYSQDAEETALHQSLLGRSCKVHVLSFSDARSMEAIAQIDGRLIKPAGSVTESAQRVMERALTRNGVKLGLFNAPSLRGEIKEWRVFVTPGFPSSVLEAHSTLGIELIDLSGRIVHRAVYSGEVNRQSPFLGEGEIGESLGQALEYALKEALSDPNFINALVSLAEIQRQ